MSNVVVVGGGILGSATAWRLAEAGVSVTLLEALPTLGDGASKASFAWINSGLKQPLHYHNLNVDGMSHYRGLQNDLGHPRWLHYCGHVEWESSANGLEDLSVKVQRLQEWGYTAELLPIEELSRIDSALKPPPHVEGFAYYPHEGYVDPVDMIADFAARARSLGARIETNAQVTELCLQGGHVTGVVTSSGKRFAADVVVNCTGSATNRLLEPLGIVVPMRSTMGMLAVTSPVAAYLTVIHHSLGLNLRPDGAGRLVMRHREFDEQLTQSTTSGELSKFTDELRKRTAKVIPEAATASIESVRVTLRPVPKDGHPVIGLIEGLDGFYQVVTHSGVTLGPMLGQLVAREIATGRREERLEPFRPGRMMMMARESLQEN